LISRLCSRPSSRRYGHAIKLWENNKPEDPKNAFSHDHPKIFPKFQTRAKEIVSNVAKLKGV
jgi:hypothetical protein